MLPTDVSPQLPLALGLPDRASFETYYPGPNAAAVAMLRGERAAGGSFLYGAEGVGKTHLLQAACRDAGEDRAVYLPLAQAVDWPVEMLQGLESMRLVAVDDLQAIAGHGPWQEAMFHLFNRVREAGGRLLFAARDKPDALGLTLPDLVSRLQWGLVLRLQDLDDGDKVAALAQRARHRGFELPVETGRYLIARCPRNLTYLFELLDRLDQASLMAQRRLTVPFIRQVLEADPPPSCG